MRRRIPLLVLAAAVTLALTLSVSAVSADSQRALAVRVELSGANEVPPAVSDASGSVRIHIVPALDRVCWRLEWTDAPGTVTAAHIHGPAPVGVNAGVLVPLTIDPAEGCVTDSDADAIAANPSNYYVNVHSTVFPGGFIRGQLN